MQGDAPVAFQLETVPSGNAEGAFLLVKSGEAAGKELPVGRIAGDVVAIGINPFGDNDTKTLDAIKSGDEVVIDNSDYLAVQTLSPPSGPDSGLLRVRPVSRSGR